MLMYRIVELYGMFGDTRLLGLFTECPPEVGTIFSHMNKEYEVVDISKNEVIVKEVVRLV